MTLVPPPRRFVGWRRHLAGAALMLGLAMAAPAAQASPADQATLVADKLEIAGDSRLIASGTVEVLYQGTRLTASRIEFDQSSGALKIEGPLRLTDASGNITLIADQGDLDSGLTEGILLSARLVLDKQLQIAASALHRSQGRYLQLDNTVASSCRVCSGSETPLWEIRARRVLHDQQERQLYFDNAQLRFVGVPVLYLPRLRMPDPTLERATGFLMPGINNTTGLGTTLTLPYFIALGPSRDLTLAPAFSTEGAENLNLRYRQAFAKGTVEVRGMVTRDDLLPGETRAYAIATGDFDLPQGFKLHFQAEGVTDDALLNDYDLADKDRLLNSAAITRTQRDDYINAQILRYTTLRSGESNSATPFLVADATVHHRFSLGTLGGEGNLVFSSHAHTRNSSTATDGSDTDDVAEGADLGRVSVQADWRRDWVLGQGIIGGVLGAIQADRYGVTDDAVYAGQTSRLTGTVGAELRWPLMRRDSAGGSTLIEPVAQILYSPDDTSNLPNEDSRLVEFDQGNLFSLNRFPGADVVETGTRANLGLTYAHSTAQGWQLGVTLGKIYRSDPIEGFSSASGLDGMSSDWLAGFTLDTGSDFFLAGRVISDDDLAIARGEMHVEYTADRYSLNSGYIWSQADTYEARPDPASELVLGGTYQVARNLKASAGGRYDFEAGSYRRATFGVEYLNECLRFNLSLSRRFNSSTSVKPSTNVGLSMELLGFGGATAAGPARICRR